MPSSFRTPLRLEFNDDTRFTLTESFEFLSETTESIIRVPAGFVTDFASIPRALWSVLPPAGRYGKAAVIHDWLYQTRNAGTRYVTRGEADRTLREGMEVLQVGRAARWTIYAGIRAGGWVTWRRYRSSEPTPV